MSALSVLIVDDATFIRDLIKKVLRANFPKWKVEEAEDGRKAMAALKARSIDLVLCDWEMPEMSGLELLQWMRQEDNLKKTPFVMITSRSDRKHVVYAVQEGVNEYIGKPFNNEQLLTKINKVLQRYFKNIPTKPGGAGGMNDSASVLANAFGGGGQKPAAKSSGTGNESQSVLMGAFGGGAAPAAAPKKTTAKKKKAAPTTVKKEPSAGGKKEPSAGGKKEPSAGGKKEPSAGGRKEPSSAAASAQDNDKKSARSKPKAVATAQLRLSSGAQAKCIIKDMDLEGLHGVVRNEGKLPEICEQAVLDLTKTVDDGDDIVARINGFIASLTAVDNKMDADWIDFEIVYVDDDPEKKEQLTRFIQLTCE